MKRIPFSLVDIFFFTLICFSINTLQAEVGTTGGLTLTRMVGARASGLGEAFTSIPGDINSISFNPSGLATLPYATFSSNYFRGVADDNFGSLAYAHPLSFGSVFVAGGLFDAGTIDLNQTGGFVETRRAQQDMLGLAGFSMGRNNPFSVGFTGKFLRSELAEEATASVFAFDGGAQWRTPVPRLTLGAAIQNVGSDLTFEQEGDPLPETIRGGVSYLLDLKERGFLEKFPYKFLFSLDGLKTKNDNSSVHGGLEISRRMGLGEMDGEAFLRGGYRSDGGTYDIGLGFVIYRVVFDYSIRLVNSLDPYHRFTLGFRFSPKKNQSSI